MKMQKRMPCCARASPPISMSQPCQRAAQAAVCSSSRASKPASCPEAATARAAAIRSAGAWLSDEQMPAYLYKTAAQPFSRLTAAVARTFSGRVSQCHSAPSSSTACAQAASKPLFLVRLCVASASVETSSQNFSS